LADRVGTIGRHVRTIGRQVRTIGRQVRTIGRQGRDHWQTCQDHWQTGQDHWQTGQDHWQTGQVHWQTGQDHWQTGQDPLQTGLGPLADRSGHHCKQKRTIRQNQGLGPLHTGQDRCLQTDRIIGQGPLTMCKQLRPIRNNHWRTGQDHWRLFKIVADRSGPVEDKRVPWSRSTVRQVGIITDSPGPGPMED
jgi:hypothetical protein